MPTFENTDVHFSLVPLLDALPALGDEWHVEDRRKWLEALDATLAALYPIPPYSAVETAPEPEAQCGNPNCQCRSLNRKGDA